MTIPDDFVIQNEILSLLASSPDGRLHLHKVYDELSKLHPELTYEEKNKKYVNSKSEWANRVQFARLHLANRGLIYKAEAGPSPARGVWIITEAGRKRADKTETSGIQPPEYEQIERIVTEELLTRELEEEFFEGKRTERLSAFFERNPKLRAAAIVHHGHSCKACKFNFKTAYGGHGEGYIEVHHLVPVSTLSDETKVNPATEMTVLCSNCHRMIHRKRNSPLSLEELRQLLEQSQ